MVELIIEDHWETRQEYIKLGNELAALERKQREEKEKEEMIRTIQGRMACMPNPTSVTTRDNNDMNYNVPYQNLFPENNFQKLRAEELRTGNTLVQNCSPGINKGRVGFQNSPFRPNLGLSFNREDSSSK